MTQTAADLRELTLRSQNEIIDANLALAESRILAAAKAGVFEVTLFHSNPIPVTVQQAVKERLVVLGFQVTLHPAGSAIYPSGALAVGWAGERTP